MPKKPVITEIEVEIPEIQAEIPEVEIVPEVEIPEVEEVVEPASPDPHSYILYSFEEIPGMGMTVTTYVLDIPHSGCLLRFQYDHADGVRSVNDVFVPNLSLRRGKEGELHLTRSIV